MKTLLQNALFGSIMGLLIFSCFTSQEIYQSIRFDSELPQEAERGLERVENRKWGYQMVKAQISKPSQSSGSGFEYWRSVIEEMDATEDEKAWLVRVMKCESNGNEYVTNWEGSGASGLMQFMPKTYAGNGGIDIWDGHEQLQIALKMYRNGQSYQWNCK